MSEDRLDVLVVGGGPVGLTMASELHRHGVRCRIIDKNAAPQPWSKAAGVSARTLEVLTDMGVVERILPKGRPVYGARVRKGTEVIAHVDFRSAETDTPYPYMLGYSQREMELTLAEHLKSLGAKFERLVELTELSQHEDGVAATLVHADGHKEHVSARWLVACDGSKSTVRALLGLPFEGSTFEQTLIQADVKVEFPFPVEPNEAQMFISDHGPFGVLPVLAEDRFRLIIMNVDNAPQEPPLSLFEQELERRAPPGTRVSDPAWTAAFRFHGRIVPSYRKDRVFLAGDAAHIHSPAGAQGMNLGIQDAYNLAWKLALVVRGLGRPEILDSYDAERRPIGRGVVETTDAATKRMMRFLSLRSKIATGLRDQLVGFLTSSEFFRDTAFRAVSGMGVGYPKSPIVGEQLSSIWSAELGSTHDTEKPGLGDRLRFTKGPGPGERVGETDLPNDGGTLFELLRGTRHVLFLFDGEAATAEGYENLKQIAKRVRKRYRGVVDTIIVVPRAERPEELEELSADDVRVVLDADGSLHEHFCCGSEALYLVRPDGYVGFRSQPADEPTLLRYLETIFTA